MLYYYGDDITKCVILTDVRITRKDVIGNEVRNLKCNGSNDVRFLASLGMSVLNFVISFLIKVFFYYWIQNDRQN